MWSGIDSEDGKLGTFWQNLKQQEIYRIIGCVATLQVKFLDTISKLQIVHGIECVAKGIFRRQKDSQSIFTNSVHQ